MQDLQVCKNVRTISGVTLEKPPSLMNATAAKPLPYWEKYKKYSLTYTLDLAMVKVYLASTETRVIKKKKHSVICCNTYTPLSHQINQIIKKHWNVLNTELICSALFRDPPLFTHSRARHIRDILVHPYTFDHCKRPTERLDDARVLSLP